MADKPKARASEDDAQKPGAAEQADVFAPFRAELAQAEEEVRQAIELLGRGEASVADRVLHTALKRLAHVNGAA